MSNMSFAIRRFTDYARKNPTQAADPTMLAALEKAADMSADDSQAALIAPKAPWNWETRVILLSGTAQSPRQPLVFPRPVDVVGFYPSVVAISNTPGLITPTEKDIDISLDTNSDQSFSAGSGVSTAAGGAVGPFVTLAAIGVQVPRLTMIALTNSQPDLGMTFKWKRGVGFYQDAFISVTVYVRYRGNQS